jgi:chloramphenicol 3-O phosphotransferase
MKKYIFWIIFIIAVLLVACGAFNYFKRSKTYGTVIILNGPSASGKSSIQREFQYLMMPNLWIKLGIDNLFDKPMPDINLENLQFWQSKNQIRWVETTQDEKQNARITLFTGPDGEKVAYGMNSAIAEYAKQGCSIIVDYIAYKKEWIDNLRNKLKNIKTYWVKVNIPLSVLEEREVARGTSPKGHARSHYNFVYWDLKYDFEVNSDKENATEIAKQIKRFFKL